MFYSSSLTHVLSPQRGSPVLHSKISCFLTVSPHISNFEPLIFLLQGPFIAMTIHVFFPEPSHSFSHICSKQKSWFLGLQMHAQRRLSVAQGSVIRNRARRLVKEAQSSRVVLYYNILDNLFFLLIVSPGRMCILFRSEIFIHFVTDCVALIMLITS